MHVEILTNICIYDTMCPQPLGHGLLSVWGLLGPGLLGRRWVEGEHARLRPYLQPPRIAHCTVWALPPLRSGVASVLRQAWTMRWATGIYIARSLWESNAWWPEAVMLASESSCYCLPSPPRWDRPLAWRQVQGSPWFCIIMSCTIILLYMTT